MSSVSTLVRDSCYFAQSSFIVPESTYSSKGAMIDVVKQCVLNMLGKDFALQSSSQFKPTGLVLYDILGQILPFSPQTAFFWKTVAFPFASMMDTAAFSISAQTTFLIFVYARVLGFMGPQDKAQSIMTIDGSSTELSWVIPSRDRPEEGKPNRNIRFAIEPLHPETGVPLLGRDILDYLTSAEGSLGVVKCDEGGMAWRKAIEHFLFPGFDGDAIPTNSRFFVGFDFNPSGTLTLKAYLLPPVRIPSSIQPATPSPIHFKDDDFRPLRDLVAKLHPSIVKPFELMLEYFDGLEGGKKPQIIILAVDCVPDQKNRLKIYFYTKEGTSFSHVKEMFTLGGRLASSKTEEALRSLELLWNGLFPAANSSIDRELDDTMQEAHDIGTQHPVGGLTWYYEFVYGVESVFPKVYLPVRNYCQNDTAIAQALEDFYDVVDVRGPLSSGATKGWYEREVARAYKQRPMNAHSGVHTYLTFALKKAGWDLTSYFSPEHWVWLERSGGTDADI